MPGMSAAETTVKMAWCEDERRIKVARRDFHA